MIVLLGLYLKFVYRGPFADWAKNSSGGALYVVAWCLAGALAFPRSAPAKVAAVALAGTCAVEFSQLWHPAFLERARGTLFGVAVLGSYFDWSDFPYYFAGAAAGWLAVRWAAAARVSFRTSATASPVVNCATRRRLPAKLSRT